MNKLIIAFALFITLSTSLTAQNSNVSETEAQQQAVKDIAVQWLKLLTTGEDIDSLLEISTTPFYINGKSTAESTERLTEFYKYIIADKGKRAIPEISSKIISKEDLPTSKNTPENALITEITISNNEYKSEKIYVFLNALEETYLVVGFLN